jgi:hypothetical protein
MMTDTQQPVLFVEARRAPTERETAEFNRRRYRAAEEAPKLRAAVEVAMPVILAALQEESES